MVRKVKLVYGFGVNDADYSVQPIINGKPVRCPFYSAWTDMLKRCYSSKCKTRYPTYIGCSVSAEWLLFSNFKLWMESQDWQGYALDKDLLFNGNKTYSPETCVFIDLITNNFTNANAATRGKWSLGVSFNKNHQRFQARCCNPFTRREEHLGYFDCQSKAHQAWRKRKHELALQLADLQTDKRAADALRSRYAP